MLKKFIKLLSILILFEFTACERFMPHSREASSIFEADLEKASPDFKQGWQDGCETGMASGSNSFNQMFYKQNQQDGWKYSYSPDYKVAWGNAFWFCYRSAGIDSKSTPWGSIFSGYQ